MLLGTRRFQIQLSSLKFQPRLEDLSALHMLLNAGADTAAEMTGSHPGRLLRTTHQLVSYPVEVRFAINITHFSFC